MTGELTFLRERWLQPAGGSVMQRRIIMPEWNTGETAFIAPLCSSCFDWAAHLARIASDATAQDANMLGVPVAVNAPPGHNRDRHCDYCYAELGDEAIGLDLAPLRSLTSRQRGGVTRHVIRQQRLCRQCYTWWRTVIADSSTVRGTSWRNGEGALGGWRSTVAFNVCGLFLQPRDQGVLEQTVLSMGRTFTASRPADVREWQRREDAIFFVGCGKSGRAKTICQGLAEDVRARVVLVSRPDSVADMAAALNSGAGDFLASPLSPQQVSGAFERVASPPASLGRDAATGLLLLDGPASNSADPVHGLTIRQPGDGDVAATAVILRRFLRGYDLVGMSAEGELTAHVRCQPEAVLNVIQRLQLILGERAEISEVGAESAVLPSSVAA
ncbi:hypothetical protein AYO38_07945 [bacterium SCGC AG-212-C10]|nr:hypothetical protein AYO38_07945 [bacterium SCGC AG-212-C10]